MTCATDKLWPGNHCSGPKWIFLYIMKHLQEGQTTPMHAASIASACLLRLLMCPRAINIGQTSPDIQQKYQMCQFQEMVINECRFRPCRYLHICSSSQEPHPVLSYKYTRPPLGRQSSVTSSMVHLSFHDV